ncbi:MAG: FHA domain-containing protein [Candidatus Poribacteria bacterium]|nr:FHA domain-containing protein [Candidatus Poribacteria bacterium]MDE0505780.1 FHA domain-containing protein [Candidatus Poribacteria bacterium]
MSIWKRPKPNPGRDDEIRQAEMLDVYTRWIKGERLSRKHKHVLKVCQESVELEPLRQLIDFAHYRFAETGSIDPRPGAKERIRDAVIRRVSRLSPEPNSWPANDIGLEPVYSPNQVGSESELAYPPVSDDASIISGSDDSLGDTIVVEPESVDANHSSSPALGNRNLTLRVTHGDEVGREFNLLFVPMIIGREADSTMRLKNNASASRKHALLSIENDELHITDLNSRNGTFVDEQRISSPTPIYLASKITVGDQVLEVTELRREEGAFHVTFKAAVGADIGQSYTASVRTITIGRGTTTNLRLSDSTGRLSRRHAGFEVMNGQIHIRDLGSTNGTHVDGIRIIEPAKIRVGSVIKFGGITCEITAIEHS